MGYEVTYQFYKKNEDTPGYDMESSEELKAAVGDPFEDVSLEQLAGAIMAQFARRDIMVFDAEVIELSRKPIKFKETSGGIILKNKKYSFDQGTQLHVQDVVEAPVLPPGVMPHEVASPRPAAPAPAQQSLVPYDEEALAEQAASQPVPVPTVRPPTPGLPGRSPIRYEIFDPDQVLAREAMKRGLKFTLKQRYPVYKETVGPTGFYDYETVDDDNTPRTLSSTHFQPETRGALIGGFQQDNQFGGGQMHAPAAGVPAEMMQVPDLRR